MIGLWSRNTEEYVPVLGLRPARPQVLDQGFSHNIGERISRLASGDRQPLAFPVDVVEGQLRDLMRP